MLDPKYVAGFLDAEGYVILNKTKYIQMGFVNTKPDIIYQLQKQYNGSIHIEKHVNPQHSTTYRLLLFNNDARLCLKNICNYLIIKKEAVDMALKFNTKLDNLEDFRNNMKKTREDVTKEADLSYEYMAGFFDGEGHIGIMKNYRKNRASARYGLEVTITNTHLGILKSIQSKIGGRIFERKLVERCKRTFSLRLRSNTGIPFLKQAMPFFIVKKEEAQIAIDFQSIQSVNTSRFPLSKESIEFKEKCRNSLITLHNRKKIIPNITS